MSLYTLAEKNIRKTWLYLGGFLIFIILLSWLISYLLDSFWILIVAILGSSFFAFLSYWHSDKIILALNRAKPIEKKDHPELYRIVENLCISAGLPLPKLYILEEKQPNAFATGRDPKHSAVVVTRGLLEILDRSELEGVIAHEISHIGNRDILLSSVVVVLVGMVVLMTDLFFRISLFGGGRRNSHQRGFLLAISLILMILAPLLAQLMRFAISRKREFLADASGALLTRYPEGLARALEKIAKDPHPMRVANNATAHLFIASPFKGKSGSFWLTKLFMTHPPIEERIKALRKMKI